MNPRKTIPLVDAGSPSDCSGAESFALMVLGDSMAPEFVEGEVIVVEPEGLARDGSFVVAQVDGEGKVEFSIDKPADYRFLRYDVK